MAAGSCDGIAKSGGFALYLPLSARWLSMAHMAYASVSVTKKMESQISREEKILITQFPDHLLELIFSYLGKEDCFNVLLTCTQFSNVLLHKKLEIGFNVTLQKYKQFLSLNLDCSVIQVLDLSFCTAKPLNVLISNCENLTSLQTIRSSITIVELCTSIAQLRKLEELHLSVELADVYTLPDSYKDLRLSTNVDKSLRRMHIAYVEQNQRVRDFNRLKFCTSYNDTPLFCFARNCKMLTSVIIDFMGVQGNFNATQMRKVIAQWDIDLTRQTEEIIWPYLQKLVFIGPHKFEPGTIFSCCYDVMMRFAEVLFCTNVDIRQRRFFVKKIYQKPLFSITHYTVERDNFGIAMFDGFSDVPAEDNHKESSLEVADFVTALGKSPKITILSSWLESLSTNTVELYLELCYLSLPVNTMRLVKRLVHLRSFHTSSCVLKHMMSSVALPNLQELRVATILPLCCDRHQICIYYPVFRHLRLLTLSSVSFFKVPSSDETALESLEFLHVKDMMPRTVEEEEFYCISTILNISNTQTLHMSKLRVLKVHIGLTMSGFQYLRDLILARCPRLRYVCLHLKGKPWMEFPSQLAAVAKLVPEILRFHFHFSGYSRFHVLPCWDIKLAQRIIRVVEEFPAFDVINSDGFSLRPGGERVDFDRVCTLERNFIGLECKIPYVERYGGLF